MTKKAKDKFLDSDLAASVRESAQQIWLAGLGAFAKAQQEGSKVFDSLIKEGTTLQQKTRGAAEDRFGDVGSRMSAMASDVSAKASQQWDKLESLFEGRVARAMGRLDTPTRDDIAALHERIDLLSAKVAALTRRPAAKKTAPRRAPRKDTKPE